MRMHVLIIVLLVLFILNSAFATTTGLNLIPTADTLPAGVFSLGAETITIRQNSESMTGSAVVTEVGIGNRAECGIDPIIDSPDVLINAKYRFLDESDYVPAFAIGMQNFNTGLDIQPFLIGYKSLSIARIHFGIISTVGEINGMFGIDKQFGDLVTLQIDYTSGPGNAFSVGVNIGGNTGWNFNPALILGNSENANGYYLDLEWAGKLW